MDARIFSVNDWRKDVHPIRYRIRKFAHRVIGLHQFEARINSVISLMKVMRIPENMRNRHQS